MIYRCSRINYCFCFICYFFFFFNDTATTEIYTLSLHDALPISTTWTPEPNADLNATPPKWVEWILPTTPLPTPQLGFDTEVGAFEGVKYFPTGAYRPWNNCMMRSLGSEIGRAHV